jgi:hypothetical protein
MTERCWANAQRRIYDLQGLSELSSDYHSTLKDLLYFALLHSAANTYDTTGHVFTDSAHPVWRARHHTLRPQLCCLHPSVRISLSTPL